MRIRPFWRWARNFVGDAFVLLVYFYLRGARRFCRKYDAIRWYSNAAQFAKHGEALAEAVEQALRCVASENQAEILAITGGDVEEFLAKSTPRYSADCPSSS
jgi:hypothetical protein